MSNNTTQTVPGMIYPTQKGYQPGAGNPRDSAMQQMAAANSKQANLSAAVGGSRRKRGGGDVVVPQVSVLYTPTGGPGTDPNAQIAGNLKTSTQGTANATYDKQALSINPPTTGGSRKRGKDKNGGNPDWLWGCYSGGKKSKRNRKTKRVKKSKKSRKNRRKH
jgi:hypothetical protein